MNDKIIAEASGQWWEKYYSSDWGWHVNTSDILTKLIQYAGRYTDQWASDLYIFWKYNMDNRENIERIDWHETWYIGFRRQGVTWSAEPWTEGNQVYDENKENDDYYRRIVKLEIGPGEYRDRLEMKLTEVA